MSDLMLKLFVSLQTLRAREEGQGLVEYALILALVSVVASGHGPRRGQATELHRDLRAFRDRARRRLKVTHVAASRVELRPAAPPHSGAAG